MKSLTVLYSSYHNYIDFSSGAALSMREVLLELSRSGARVRTLCGSFFDSVDVGEREYLMTLKALGIDAKIVENQISLGRSNATLRLVIFNDHGIEGTTFFLKNVVTSSKSSSIGSRRISRLHDVVYLRLFLHELMESWPQFYCTYCGIVEEGDESVVPPKAEPPDSSSTRFCKVCIAHTTASLPCSYISCASFSVNVPKRSAVRSAAEGFEIRFSWRRELFGLLCQDRFLTPHGNRMLNNLLAYGKNVNRSRCSVTITRYLTT